MSEKKMISPLLDGMIPVGDLPQCEGSCTFHVTQKGSGANYFVKCVSVPETCADTNALILTGAISNESEATAYYGAVVDQYRKELASFRKLAAKPNICTYLKFQVVPKENEPGFDIYLLAPERTSLAAYLSENAISKRNAVQLGIDLCNALITLRDAGMLHQDIRPENIFFENGQFSIGDFGLAKLDMIRYAFLPTKYSSRFTAPELSGFTCSLNETCDIYSVGMILYYVFNGNHLPFEEAGATAKSADGRRLSGDPLPTPLYADYEIDGIIRKACAFRKEDRYQNPNAFLSALLNYRDRNELLDEAVVPPITFDADLITEEEENDPDQQSAEPFENGDAPQPVRFADVDKLSDDFKQSFQPSVQKEKKKKQRNLLWIPILLAALIILGVGASYYYFDYSAITVSDISVTDKGPDYLTFNVNCSDPSGVVVTCTSSDGSFSESRVCEETMTFSVPYDGQDYVLSAASNDWHHIKGVLSYTTATAGLTSLRSFEAVTNENGITNVSFLVSGPEPSSWLLHCIDQDGNDTIYTVENHLCTIPDIVPNAPYTLRLEAGKGYFLDGNYELPYTYEKAISGSDLTVLSANDGAIEVSWMSDSDIPTEWTVVCSGDNGFAKTFVTSECYAKIEGTDCNAEYTIAVSSATMTAPMLLSLQIKACDITSFTANETEDGILVKWAAEGGSIPKEWILTCSSDLFDEDREFKVSGTEYEVKDLVPGAKYTFRLSTEDRYLMGGTSEVTATSAPAEDYTDHDFGGLFIAVYRKPSGNWTYKNINTNIRTFNAGEPVIFAIESSAKPQKQEEPETIQAMLVIRDADGNPVSAVQEEFNWNEMWINKMFLMAIDDVPETPGSYTIELYFNRCFLCKASLKLN